MANDLTLSPRASALLDSLRRRHEDPSIPNVPVGRPIEDLPDNVAGSAFDAGTEQQIASDVFLEQGPRYQVKQPKKQGFLERLNARSTKSTYRRETRGGYGLSLFFRILLLFGAIGGAIYGNLFFLIPETARFVEERAQGSQAERQIPGFTNQIKQLKTQLATVQADLKSKAVLFSSREFFRTRISEFLFELESAGGQITTLCIGRLQSKGTLDPCNSSPEAEPQKGKAKKKADKAPPPKGSGQQFSQVYSGFLMGNPFEAAKDAIKIEEIAKLDPSFGSVGVDGVILELEGSSESYFIARQSLVRDIPAIVLLGENIKYQQDSNSEKIQLVFSYPYSGD